MTKTRNTMMTIMMKMTGNQKGAQHAVIQHIQIA